MQATAAGVIDPVGEWVQPDGDHGEYSFERQARSAGLILGRKTCDLEEFAYALAEKGRGTVRLELDDVKRVDSGIVLLTYRPAA